MCSPIFTWQVRCSWKYVTGSFFRRSAVIALWRVIYTKLYRMITSYLFPPKCSSHYLLLHNLFYIQHVNEKEQHFFMATMYSCTRTLRNILFSFICDFIWKSRKLKSVEGHGSAVPWWLFLTAKVKQTQNWTKRNINNLLILPKYEVRREKNIQSVSINHTCQRKEIKMYYYLFYSIFLQ